MSVNAAPQSIFLIEGIQDPVVRNNFDILTKQLQLIKQNKNQVPANYVVGPVLSSTFTAANAGGEVLTPVAVTIKGRGNPIKVRILNRYPKPFSGVIPIGTGIDYLNSAANNPGCVFKWYRSNSSGTRTVAFSQTLNLPYTGSAMTANNIQSVFELFDDSATSDTYTYQLAINPAVAGTTVNLYYICALAYELR